MSKTVWSKRTWGALDLSTIEGRAAAYLEREQHRAEILKTRAADLARHQSAYLHMASAAFIKANPGLNVGAYQKAGEDAAREFEKTVAAELRAKWFDEDNQGEDHA